MEINPIEMARKLLKKEWDALHPKEKHVLAHIAERTHATEDINAKFKDDRTFGQRLADRISEFGGSWTFLISFFLVIFCWVLINAYVLAARPFDPYPFILLNLVLSMLAAVQAPVIMMSQNRQAIKDRIRSENDYEVNLKTELELRLLQERHEELHTRIFSELVRSQQEELSILQKIQDNLAAK